MSFPRSESESFAVHTAADRAIESHGKTPEYLDAASLKMREDEHTGIELTGAELAYVRKLILEKMRSNDTEISQIKSALDGGTGVNRTNFEAKLEHLTKTKLFLAHNLAEKLFTAETKSTESATVH